jgi:hypothetical protein
MYPDIFCFFLLLYRLGKISVGSVGRPRACLRMGILDASAYAAVSPSRPAPGVGPVLYLSIALIIAKPRQSAGSPLPPICINPQ